MAYGNYYPQLYPQQYYAPQNTQNSSLNAQPQSGSVILWVQGEAGAKAFPVGAGQSVQLMDSEENVFYIKSVDQSGMPRPLRIFDYKERSSDNSDAPIQKNIVSDDFVSRKEFDEFREDVKRSIKGMRRPKYEQEEE